jgi:hypothetical protein
MGEFAATLPFFTAAEFQMYVKALLQWGHTHNAVHSDSTSKKGTCKRGFRKLGQ